MAKLNDLLFSMDYKGNLYSIMEGELTGLQCVPVSWKNSNGEDFINVRVMAEEGINNPYHGQIISIPYSVFDSIVALERSNMNDYQSSSAPPPPPQQKYENVQQNQNVGGKETKKQIPQSPIRLVLDNLKNLRKENIQIDVDIDVIDDGTYSLLTNAFGEKESYNEVINYFLSKVDMELVKSKVEENLKRHINSKFNINGDLDSDVLTGELIQQ